MKLKKRANVRTRTLSINQMESFLRKTENSLHELDIKNATKKVWKQRLLLKDPARHFSEIRLAKKSVKSKFPKKPTLKYKITALWLCFGVLAGLLVPNIYKSLSSKPDNRPVSSFPTEDLFPNPDIPKDEDGNIIENPVIDKELSRAFLILEKKLLSDAKRFGKKFSFITSIKGIYEHQTLSENSGKESIIEILFEADGKINSLQYINFNETQINLFGNDTKNIMEFFNFLPSCYPYNCYTQEDNKAGLLQKLNSSIFISDPFVFTYHSNIKEYHIVSYNENGSFTLFKTDKNYLDNYDIDPLKALEEYIDNKNQLFSQSTNESEFTTITSACENALKIIANNPEITLEQEANISQNSIFTEKPFEI